MYTTIKMATPGNDDTTVLLALLVLVVCCCCSSSSFLITGGLLLTKKEEDGDEGDDEDDGDDDDGDEDEDEDEDEDDEGDDGEQLTQIPHQIPSGDDGWCIHGEAVHQDVPGCGRICSDPSNVGSKNKNTWGSWGDNQNDIDCPAAKLDQIWAVQGDGSRKLVVGEVSK